MMAEPGRRNVENPTQETFDNTEVALSATLYQLKNEQDVQIESRKSQKFSLFFFGQDTEQQELQSRTREEERRKSIIQPYLTNHPNGSECSPYCIRTTMRRYLDVGFSHPPLCSLKPFTPCRIFREQFEYQRIQHRLQNPVTVEFAIERKIECLEPFYQDTFSVHLDSDIDSQFPMSRTEKYAIHFYN